MSRFPKKISNTDRPDNPAIRTYGLRFYKDQTPVEYLAELLLVFTSPKGSEPTATVTGLEGEHAFSFGLGNGDSPAQYWPEDRISLKLFAFFPTSKLDTRHEVHQQAYIEALQDLSARIEADFDDKYETIRLLQSLFAGFVGVSANRTWATNSFLPASSALLSRELDWLHSKAIKDTTLTDWEAGRKYFATDRHNYMARGGELLFLQLAHLFHSDSECLTVMIPQKDYAHLVEQSLRQIQEDIEQNLKILLLETTLPVSLLADFIDQSISKRIFDKPHKATLGWTPVDTLPIALLFAAEFRNVLLSSLSDLEKIDLLKNLCCLQVLRTHCFLASKEDDSSAAVDGFLGRYTWIVASETSALGQPLRKLAERSFTEIEQLLFRVLRQEDKAGGSLAEADKHGFQIFRKLAKDIDLVIPRTGKGQRFVLPPKLLHFLVIALVEPGRRIPLDTFYARVFAHYGIALGPRQLAAALAPHDKTGTGAHHNYAIAADTTWIEDALRQGDFLVELSDAVSIVRNPSSRTEEIDA